MSLQITLLRLACHFSEGADRQKKLRGLIAVVASMLFVLPLSIRPAFGAVFYEWCVKHTSAGDVYLPPWPKGILAYEFAASVTRDQRIAFVGALHEWELAGDLHFVPHTNEKDYLIVHNDGKQDTPFPWQPNGKGQRFWPGGWSRNQILHEVGHVLGLTHPFYRADRDAYVNVLPQNVSPSEKEPFPRFGVPHGAYDMLSVMNTIPDLFSKEPGKLMTIVPREPFKQFYRFSGGNLSPGDQEAISLLYGPGPVLGPFVTNTSDEGPGSLRAAIHFANSHPGTTIRFRIPRTDPGYSAVTHRFTIQLIDALPSITADRTSLQGGTQGAFDKTDRPGPSIAIAGDFMKRSKLGQPWMVRIYLALECEISGLAVSGSPGAGVMIEGQTASRNRVTGCVLGRAETDVSSEPNINGIQVCDGAHNNLIGDTEAGSGNIISGSEQYGVVIIDAGTSQNRIQGNVIGLDRGGRHAVPNGANGIGIWAGASLNVIGGTAPRAGNIISGNKFHGVIIGEPGTKRNEVLGNSIGTNVDGTEAVPNGGHGILLYNGAVENVIGGMGNRASNLIAGNAGAGVQFMDANTTQNSIIGNVLRANGGGAFGGNQVLLSQNSFEANR